MNRSAVAQDATTEPRPHRLTREDFRRMGEAGIFAPDARVELIEGEIIDMPPPGQKHKSKVNRLDHLLVRAVGEQAIVSVRNPAILGTWSEPQPDPLRKVPVPGVVGVDVDLSPLFRARA